MYTLRNPRTNQTIEVYRPMKDAPTSPCTIDGVEYVRDYAADTPAMTVRQYGCQMPDATNNNMPVSRTLPTVREPGEVVTKNGQRVRRHADGLHTTMNGRPIIASRKDEELAANRFKMRKET